ncbi:hypothetical protein GN958_ATG18936 [Phytophthora infestans]|uniref:Uncharacterized protein n=1 Tax=Phytophthora infestans TaxID=4787 RepID=A0A8S9TV56_PHYIN|nr:hypothetical protein GN958_ATG18936 [Phytophthora infestans]
MPYLELLATTAAFTPCDKADCPASVLAPKTPRLTLDFDDLDAVVLGTGDRDDLAARLAGWLPPLLYEQSRGPSTQRASREDGTIRRGTDVVVLFVHWGDDQL